VGQPDPCLSPPQSMPLTRHATGNPTFRLWHARWRGEIPLSRHSIPTFRFRGACMGSGKRGISDHTSATTAPPYCTTTLERQAVILHGDPLR
jgi:hypothetical protein